MSGEGWYRETEPTWNEDGTPKNGIEKRVCRFDSCGHHTETRTIVPEPCDEHNWGDWETVKEASCTDTGERKHTCKVCHQTVTEELPAQGHSYQIDEEKSCEASCTKDGKTISRCTACGDTIEKTIKATGHHWGDWTVVKSATASEEGSEERVCSVCHEKETRPLPKLQNVYPGTEDLYLVEYSDVWPTWDEHDGDNWKNDKKPFVHSGIIKYNNKYWAIIKDESLDYYQAATPEKLNDNNIICLKGDVLDAKNTHPNNERRDANVPKGAVVKGYDGAYYLRTKSDIWSDPPAEGKDGWYKIPNAVSSASNAASTAKRVQTVSIDTLMRSLASSVANAVLQAVEDGTAEQSVADGRGNVTNKNLTLEQLLKDLNLEDVGVKNENTGDTLTLYNPYDKVTLETKSDSDTLVDGQTNLWRSKAIPVLLGENGIDYRYYVLETAPKVGGDYRVTYDGQAEGLTDSGKVKISNQKEYTKLIVKKEWSDIDENDHQNDIVKYALYRIPRTDEADYDPEQVDGAEGYTGELKYNDDQEKAWKEIISKLPKTGTVQPKGATEPIPVTYKYYVSEAPFDGYKSSTHGVAGEDGLYTVTIKNEPQSPIDKSTEIDISKKWLDSKGKSEVDTDKHNDDSITFRLTQKKYAAITKDTRNTSIYSVKIDLIDGNGSVSAQSKVLFVPEGSSVTITPSRGTAPISYLSHKVHGNGFGTDKKFGNGEKYSGDSFKLTNITSNHEVTLRLLDSRDVWGEKADSLGGNVWEMNLNSSPESAFTEDNLLSNVDLSGTPAETRNLDYSMSLNDAKTGTVIAPVQADLGEGMGTGKWSGKVIKLPLIERDGETIYVYTYEVTEVKIGADTVETENPATGFNGQTSNYNVKWDKNGNTGSWTITNQEKPAIDFDILKVEEGNIAKTLEGASFTIQRIKPTSETQEPQTDGEAKPSAPETTGKDGMTSFKGIEPGYYQVTETNSPKGYIITGDDSFYIKVEGTSIKLLEKVVSNDKKLTFKETDGKVGNVVLSSDGTKVTFRVENEPGKSLPATGGIGTRLTGLVGILMSITSGAALLLRRRKKYS